MADVAKLAGVSLQTVSRVINDSPHVRAATRQRVEDAMRKLEYRPNPVARALVTGRSRTLGVVSFDTTLFGPASTLFGIERAAHDADYFVSIVSLRSLDRSSVMSAVERLRAQGVDGILVIAPQESASQAILHLPQDVPVVAAEAGPGDSVPLVAVDQVEGARLATQHLLDLGHRTVWHISGPSDWLEAQARVDGWRSTLEAAGAAPPPLLVGDWSARAGHELGRELGPGRHRRVRGQRPDGARRRALAARGGPPDPGRHQRGRVRRHPRGRVLHAAADHRAAELQRDGPAQPAAAARADREPQPRAGPRDGAARADRAGEHDFGRRELRVTDSPLDPSLPATDESANGCVVGVDYGTLSARAVVVRAHDGEELGSAVHEYAHGVIDSVLPETGAELPPDWALQHPDDYIQALREAVPAALKAAGVAPSDVVGIATDFTASTPLPTLRDGTPLCSELPDRPHAYPKLWKHHAAQPEADRVNAVAEERGEPWLARYGGRISSEWEFAKALQVLDEDPEIYDRAERWIEAADWIVWRLCGQEVRNVCSTGYKAIYQDGQLPVRGLPARSGRALRRTSWRSSTGRSASSAPAPAR